MAVFQSLPEVNENMAESYAWLIVILMQIQTYLRLLYFKKNPLFSCGGFSKISKKFLIFPVKEHFFILINDFDVTM